MRLRAPLNRRDSFRLPPDVLRSTAGDSRGLGGSGWGFSGGSEGKRERRVFMLLECHINMNFLCFARLVSLCTNCLLHCAFARF